MQSLGRPKLMFSNENLFARKVDAAGDKVRCSHQEDPQADVFSFYRDISLQAFIISAKGSVSDLARVAVLHGNAPAMKRPSCRSFRAGNVYIVMTHILEMTNDNYNWRD